MNPIYKFTLSVNGQSQQAYPVYKDDLAIDYALEQNQEFYRGKLSGKLTFQKDDYLFIQSKAFDTQFDVVISISYDGGQTWVVYWSGQFWKTDCQFNKDDQTATVTPNVKDRYNEVLAGMEKEYNLIDLVPEMIPVNYDKRPMIQIYVPGQRTVACFLSGMWWEQECEPKEDVAALYFVNRFLPLKGIVLANVSGNFSPAIPSSFYTTETSDGYGSFDVTKDGFELKRYVEEIGPSLVQKVEIIRVSDNVKLWQWDGVYQPILQQTYTLEPVSGSGATGNVVLDVSALFVMGRYVCDVDMVGTEPTVPIPEDDFVYNNRNYTRICGYGIASSIEFSVLFSSTPTKWGIYQPGRYYVSPESVYNPVEYFPIARNLWNEISMWFKFSEFDGALEQAGRKASVLKDCYKLSSVISVLLNQVAPGVTHQENVNYSAFLYGQNPVTAINQILAIAPKSNVVKSGYDQPAQKAPITLKTITDMLRDCFRCYWFIDEQNRFRIEHISWFMRGGSYSTTPVVGVDLTQQIVTRNGKPWAYARNQYQFDKPEMASRYQFGWMDDVTQLFDGFPIEIVSKYVNPDNIEQIEVTKFTSDIDYILLNPEAISLDGFVLLSVDFTTNKLPYLSYTIGNGTYYLQNAYVAFMFLQNYYTYDMPARLYKINGVQFVANGIKKLKTQTIKLPVLTEPNLINLIKTELGDGVIQKMSVNLSSRNANTTLKYDTE